MLVSPVMALVGLFVSAALAMASAEATDRRMVLTFDDLPAQRAQALSSQRIVEINQELVALLASREIPAISGFKRLLASGNHQGRRASPS